MLLLFIFIALHLHCLLQFIWIWEVLSLVEDLCDPDEKLYIKELMLSYFKLKYGL